MENIQRSPIDLAQLNATDAITLHDSVVNDGKRLGDFIDALERLAQGELHRELAIEIYAGLTKHESFEARTTAASIIDHLGAVDPDITLAMWEALLDDSEREVRDMAYETLTMRLVAKPEERRMEISTYDASRLAYTYYLAEERAGGMAK